MSKSMFYHYAEYKFRPFIQRQSKYFNSLIHSVAFMLWNHWLNPFGNWHEPLPFPEKNALAAKKSWMHPAIWWFLRNPLHNFTHFWIGIVPVFHRYAWVDPSFAGWGRLYYGHKGLVAAWSKTFHIRGIRVKMFLPFYQWYFDTREDNYFELALGWRGRGNFTITFRRRSA